MILKDMLIAVLNFETSSQTFPFLLNGKGLNRKGIKPCNFVVAGFCIILYNAKAFN